MPVKFYLDTRKNQNGERPIRASLCCKGVKLVTTIGLSVAESCWEDGRISYPSCINAAGLCGADIQKAMDSLMHKVGRWERRLMNPPAREMLRKKTREFLTPSEGACGEVHRAFIAFLREQSVENQWSQATVAAFRSFGKRLARFNPEATFDDLDADGIGSWLLFLRSEGLEESTVRKEFQHLRWFLNWAARQGYATPAGVMSFRPKFKVAEKPVIFLTRAELMRLYRFRIPADTAGARRLEDTRNCFCFCAFTSLRYSDMVQARWSHIENGVLYVTTQKTFDRLAIDLSPQARALLARYPRGSFDGDRIFPPLSNLEMNAGLKRLCKLCGINTPVTKWYCKGGRRIAITYPKYELIGTHAARRTFICFALSNGIPPQVVMKWTGHSDYKSMRPYIDVASGTSAAAMRRIARAWEG